MTKLTIEPMQQHEAETCEQILRELPAWFGIEEAIQEYRRDIEQMETLVARDSEQIIGFVTVRQHFPESGEIQVMAVRSNFHGRGVGRMLVESAENHFRKTNTPLLQVKTLGASHPDAGYAKTRAFYRAVGFLPLEETDLWGEDNPCLIMVKPLLRKK